MSRSKRRETRDGPIPPPPTGRTRRSASIGLAHSPTPRRSSRGREILEVLARAAEELSRLIEAGRVARDRRQEARRLLMEAWIAAGAGGAGKRDVDSLRGLLRAVDLLVADPGDLGEATARRGLLHLSSRPTMIEVAAGTGGPTRFSPRDQGAVARINALERATIAIVRRTESMVEHALTTLEQGRAGTKRGPASHEGREDLELVWGETEG